MRWPDCHDLPGLACPAGRRTSPSDDTITAHAAVLLRYHTHALELEILDDGCGAGPGPPGRAGRQSGHGLAGMRERVTLYGGTLHAGPRAAPARTGYAVRARLPAKPDGT